MSEDLTLRSATGYQVESTEEVYTGAIFSLRADQVRMPDGHVARRDLVEHPGAVAVVALDDDDHVVLIEQYRHSAAAYLWELPAGILDHPGEVALDAGQRELSEEVGLAAGQWWTLLDVRTAVGFSDEAVRIFLARDLRAAVDEAFVREGEEADMRVRHVPLAECVAAALDGRIENCLAAAGVLATKVALAAGLDSLRPPDAPWPSQKR